MTPELLVGLGLFGGLGAVLRFVIDSRVSTRAGRAFPYGTLVVNLLGCFALGVLDGAALGKDPQSLFGTGLIGGFTTFSTWMLESQRAGEDGRLLAGLTNVWVSLMLGVLIAWAGRSLGAG
jgi:CrcB protein